MQITLNIDASNMSETVGEVFKTLTEDQKTKIAQEVLLNWLSEPYPVEFNTKKAAVIGFVRANYSTIKDESSWQEKAIEKATDKEIENSRQFKDKMKDWKSSRTIMVEETTAAIVKTYKDYATEFVKTDPQTQKVLEDAIAEISKEFPKIIHDALVGWFSGYLTNLASGLQSALFQSQNAEIISKQIAQKINGYQ